MPRGPKPAKSTEAKPPVARKAPKDNARVRDLEKRLAEAQEQLQTRDRELAEAREQLTTTHAEVSESHEQQTATSELLKVIGQSTFDLQPVLETLAENAVRLCEAERAFVFRFDGQVLRGVASHNASPELIDFVARHPIAPGRGSATAIAAAERRTVHLHDILADPEHTYHVQIVDPVRTLLAVPMLRAHELLGVIVIYRHEVLPFTESHVALMENFADQAAIAIENVRLLNETKEALEQQTATTEILNVISRSPTDVQPVFDTVVEHASRLCSARDAQIFRREDAVLRLVAHHGPIPTGGVGEFTMPITRGTVNGRAVMEQRPIVVAHLRAESMEFPEGSAISRNLGHRAVLSVPLMREGVAIGTLSVRRAEVVAFTDAQLALLQTFADQAVIAIENVRLFNETKEALERQTATSEILQVISRSPTDIQPVFDAIVANGMRLCEGEQCVLLG